jgi:putative Mn2+ efflux pump MntP
MLRLNRIRLFTVLVLCFAMTVTSVQAQTMFAGGFGPSNGQIAAAAVGAGIVIVIGVYVVYKVIPKQKTITGCAEASENGLKMTDVKDKKTYILENETATIKPGQHLRVKGKKSKDKSGILRLSVRKIVKDLGSCAQSPIS